MIQGMKLGFGQTAVHGTGPFQSGQAVSRKITQRKKVASFMHMITNGLKNPAHSQTDLFVLQQCVQVNINQ